MDSPKGLFLLEGHHFALQTLGASMQGDQWDSRLTKSKVPTVAWIFVTLALGALVALLITLFFGR
ncbi:MAG TPA: hypothetical protein VLY23_17800 [Candidatus Acidoferrum sp.]|nr:hypothetical protein [Candidatus Acidoferrum sp.]